MCIRDRYIHAYNVNVHICKRRGNNSECVTCLFVTDCYTWWWRSPPHRRHSSHYTCSFVLFLSFVLLPTPINSAAYLVIHTPHRQDMFFNPIALSPFYNSHRCSTFLALLSTSSLLILSTYLTPFFRLQNSHFQRLSKCYRYLLSSASMSLTHKIKTSI